MYNEILLTKNKMDLNNWKIKNHPPFPVEAVDELSNNFLYVTT